MRNGNLGLKIFVGVAAMAVLALIVITILVITKYLNRNLSPIDGATVALEEHVNEPATYLEPYEATAIAPLATVNGEPLANNENNPAGHIDSSMLGIFAKDPSKGVQGGLVAPIVD